MADRRSHIRFSVKGSAKLKTENGPVRVLDTELIDVSFKGIAVYSKENIEIGTPVQFELMLEPIGWIFVGRGIVRNITEIKKLGYPGFRIGMAFTEMNKELALELINNIQAIKTVERRKAKLRIKIKDKGPSSGVIKGPPPI